MASNTVYIIYDTAGQPITAIQPNTFDGPGGIQQNSDLTMYGLGFPTWGQGADQNDYHLVENFACPDMTTYTTSPRYPAIAAAGALTYTPASAIELGDGNGINVPIVGQLWFNTSLQSMYVYTETSVGPPATYQFNPVEGVAVTVSPTTPVSPSVGQLWFNTTTQQLEIYNGTSYVSVAAQYLPLAGGTMSGSILMGGNNIRGITMAGSPLSTDVATVGYVNSQVAGGAYVPITGTIAGHPMTGTLVMSSAGITQTSGPGITLNSTTGLTINTGTITVTSPTGGVAMTANGRVTGVTTTSATDAASVTFGDGRWLNKTLGGTVSGPTTFSGATTFTASTVVPTPTLTTQAANKGYADGTSSLLAKGYQVYPSGLTKIWGTVVVPASGGASVNFLSTSGKTFTHACFGVLITIVQPSGSGAGLGVPFVYGVTASGFSSDNTSGAVATTIYWEATGW
jgi:hypothetical protein